MNGYSVRMLPDSVTLHPGYVSSSFMVNYRRHRIAGGSYFFTVTLRDRRSHLLVEHIDLLREAFGQVRDNLPFEIEAAVILPDHLHTIWTLPQQDDRYPARWQAIKSCFSRALAKRITITKDERGEYRLWQRRYWEHTLRDEDDRQRHIDYIHYNPVKHGHVERVVDWSYSSFHRYVRRRILPLDWGDDVEINGDFGE